MGKGVPVVVLAGASLGLAAVLIYAATRGEGEKAIAVTKALLPEEEEVISIEFRSGKVYWAALADWEQVHLTFPNEWPADTDVTFAWEIKNTGKVGAYFKVYMFEPGEWLYVDPGEKLLVFEEVHTQVVPVLRGYQYGNIYVLGRKIDGERIGAVWVSEEIEITYV